MNSVEQGLNLAKLFGQSGPIIPTILHLLGAGNDGEENAEIETRLDRLQQQAGEILAQEQQLRVDFDRAFANMISAIEKLNQTLVQQLDFNMLKLKLSNPQATIDRYRADRAVGAKIDFKGTQQTLRQQVGAFFQADLLNGNDLSPGMLFPPIPPLFAAEFELARVVGDLTWPHTVQQYHTFLRRAIGDPTATIPGNVPGSFANVIWESTNTGTDWLGNMSQTAGFTGPFTKADDLQKAVWATAQFVHAVGLLSQEAGKFYLWLGATWNLENV